MTYNDLGTDYIYRKVLGYAEACSAPSPEDTVQDFFLKAGVHFQRHGNVDKYFYDTDKFNLRLAYVSVWNIVFDDRVRREPKNGILSESGDFEAVFSNHLITDPEIQDINLYSVNLFTDREKELIRVRLEDMPFKDGLAVLKVSNVTFAKIKVNVQKKLLMYYYK